MFSYKVVSLGRETYGWGVAKLLYMPARKIFSKFDGKKEKR